MIEDGKLKCNGGLGPNWLQNNNFDVGVLKASPLDDQGDPKAIMILNKAVPPKELAINVAEANANEPEVGKRAVMKAKSLNASDERNKWTVTKHRIDKKDWFTLKNEAFGYFLTCPNIGQSPLQLIVSYEIPGIQMTSF